MLMHGGNDESFPFSDLWEFSFSYTQAGSWRLLDEFVPTGPRRHHASVWASNLGSGKMLIYGGLSYGVLARDISAYDPASRQWEVLDATGGVHVYATAAAWSPTRRAMRVFGGLTSLAGAPQNFLREWSSDDGWVIPTDLYPTLPPPTRHLHNAVWMASEDGAEAGS